MADKIFMDYEGSHQASEQFKQRSEDLAALATEMDLKSQNYGQTSIAEIAIAEFDVALAGRLRDFSTQLHSMSQLVKDAVKVYNEVDVAAEFDITAPPRHPRRMRYGGAASPTPSTTPAPTPPPKPTPSPASTPTPVPTPESTAAPSPTPLPPLNASNPTILTPQNKPSDGPPAPAPQPNQWGES